MKRALTVAFIALYLGALGYGNLCHMLGYGTTAHPLMYFVVWDMFCGWSAYDSRLYIVGETEDQKYYELAPGPWGEFKPWGSVGRQHYDMVNSYTRRLALNALAHAKHEDLSRIFVIEECWPKKFNLPDAVWSRRYDDEKDLKKYYRVRTVLLPDGTVARHYDSWMSNQVMMVTGDNPRLQQQASQSRSLFLVDPLKPGREMGVGSGSLGANRQPASGFVGSPLGN